VSLKAISNRGWSDKLRELFPNIIPALRPSVKSQIIPDPNWVSGFVEGQGSFYVKISNKDQVSLRFLVTQHARDAELLKNLIIFFKCGYYLPRSNSTIHGDFFVTNLKDIRCKILPKIFSSMLACTGKKKIGSWSWSWSWSLSLGEKFPLQGNKLKDLLDFKKAVELKGGDNSTNLTIENLEKIKQIKQGMNKNRISDENENKISHFNISSRNPLINNKGFINKRHYSTTPIISKEQPDQTKFLE